MVLAADCSPVTVSTAPPLQSGFHTVPKPSRDNTPRYPAGPVPARLAAAEQTRLEIRLTVELLVYWWLGTPQSLTLIHLVSLPTTVYVYPAHQAFNTSFCQVVSISAECHPSLVPGCCHFFVFPSVNCSILAISPSPYTLQCTLSVNVGH